MNGRRVRRPDRVVHAAARYSSGAATGALLKITTPRLSAIETAARESIQRRSHTAPTAPITPASKPYVVARLTVNLRLDESQPTCQQQFETIRIRRVSSTEAAVRSGRALPSRE
jgi:hypothetical protein